jgi:hypothetical protein
VSRPLGSGGSGRSIGTGRIRSRRGSRRGLRSCRPPIVAGTHRVPQGVGYRYQGSHPCGVRGRTFLLRRRGAHLAGPPEAT